MDAESGSLLDARLNARERLLLAAREELAEHGDAAISLRAVARRAGLSHAAPAHFFTDRAGLLTAVATDGFRELTQRLDGAGETANPPQDALTSLGRAYVDFGLEHPALVDLMFRRSDLHHDDPDLRASQEESISRLIAAVAPMTAPAANDDERATPDTSTAPETEGHNWALISWALVHGLVILAREGALAGPAGRADDDSSIVAHDLLELYAAGLRQRGAF